MTKAKKVLSLVLAVVMVAATFAFSASAANEKNATFTVSVDKATVSQGEVITVTVKLTTNYYAGPTNVPVYYNPAVFEFVEKSVTGTNIFGATATDVQSHNDTATGCLKVAFIPNTADSTAAAKVMNGENLFTFKLRAIADGPSNIGLKPGDQKTSSNIGGPLYCGAYGSSAITANPDTVGQTFTIHNASATVGSAAKPELQLSEYGAEMGAAIVQTSNYAGYVGCVFGIDTYNGEAIANYLTTPAGSIEIVANDEGSDAGTGAVINLLDDSGRVVESYLFILFGDVDGNGYVDSVDAGTVAEAEVGLTEFMYDYCELAADFDGNGYFDSVDAGYIAEFEVGLYDTTQADIAVEVLSQYSF